MEEVETGTFGVVKPEEDRAGGGAVGGFGDFLELDVAGFLEGGEGRADGGCFSEGDCCELFLGEKEC